MEMNHHYIDESKYMSRYLMDPLQLDHEVPKVQLHQPHLLHTQIHHQPEPTIAAPVIGHTYDDAKVVYLNEYIVKHALIDKEKILCVMCNMEFTSSKAAVKHSKIHGGTTNTDSSVSNSPESTSKPSKPMTYNCQTCNITFPDAAAKKSHMLSEHKGKTSSSPKAKNITCEICYKCFAQPAHLTNHLLVHTGVRNYSCQYCDKKFKQRGHVINHHKIHLDEKSYKCLECGKSFRQTAHLRTHIKIHTGEKDHVCILCSKVFTQSGQLQTHMRTHTNERKYQCHLCDMKFKQSGHLQSHLKRHEKKMLAEDVKIEEEDVEDEEGEEEDEEDKIVEKRVTRLVSRRANKKKKEQA